MAKKRRDDTSLSSLLGRKREINIDEIEKATQKVHEPKPKPPLSSIPKEVKDKIIPTVNSVEKKPKKKAAPVKKTVQAEKPPSSEQVVRASISTPYELYIKAKRLQRKAGYRSLGAFYLHVVEDYLKKPLTSTGDYKPLDSSDNIDVSVSPELELWMEIKLNQRRLGFKNMAGFYVFCLERYLKKKG